MTLDEDSTVLYRVILNHEEQYTIHRLDRDIPPGWKPDGMEGTKAECLAHIDVVWTDMRPLSLRQRTASVSEPSK